VKNVYFSVESTNQANCNKNMVVESLPKKYAFSGREGGVPSSTKN